MFARISYTWRLMLASWDVLKKDKALLLFPLMSGACCLLVLATFAIPLLIAHAARSSDSMPFHLESAAGYGLLFCFYMANYFVITFFNTAIISCAVQRLSGGAPTVADGFREAFARLPLIAEWAVVQATVGLVLRIIEDRSQKLGQIVAGLLGIAWTVAGFLVLPVLVVERKGPFAALKESTVLLKKTWGEQFVGGFSFGAIFVLLMLPAVLLVVLGFVTHSAVVIFACIGFLVIYLVALSLIQSALQSIFQAAVYLYARNATAPEGFSADLLSGAMRPK